MPNKKLLMVAHNFPPMFRSGTLRMTGFASNLPQFGWDSHILTVQHDPTDKPSDTLVHENGVQTSVRRVSGPDFTRLFSVAGKRFAFTGYPDKYNGWILPAVRTGTDWMAKRRYNAIFSSFPVVSSHIVAGLLKQRSGLPWVADFRDPMAQKNYPTDPVLNRLWRWIERKIVQLADKITVTTRSSHKWYRDRYEKAMADKFILVENGYNEDDFNSYSPDSRSSEGTVTLIHAGAIYPVERNPLPLFKGIRLLKERGGLNGINLDVRFYGSGVADMVKGFENVVNTFGIREYVRFLPKITHDHMIREISKADILLLMQSASCDYQIPAKVYEYFRAMKPILALTTETGDTGRLVLDNRAGVVAPMDDEIRIAETLERMLADISGKKALPTIDEQNVAMYSRRFRAEKLAQILNRLSS